MSSRKSSRTRSATISTSPSKPIKAERHGNRFRQGSEPGNLRLRHAPIWPAWSANTGSSAMRACRWRSMSPRNSATAKCRCQPIAGGAVHLAVRRDGRYAGIAALLQGGRAEDRRRRQCQGIDHRPRIRCRLPDPGRAGNRRRLDQGLYLPACRAGRRWPSGAGQARGTITPERGKGAGHAISPKCRAS